MTYTTYLPHVSLPPPDPRRGVGMTSWHKEDIDRLRCGWWYSWGISAAGMLDDRFVPMSWAGSSALSLPLDYAGYLLVMNEPEGRLQANLAPQEGADRVLSLVEKFTQAKLIVGGTGRWAGDWIARFKTMLGEYKPTGYHIHYYIEQAANTIQDFRDYVNRYRDALEGELWLSEFGDPVGDGVDLMQAARELPLDRYAWFANRVDVNSWYWPTHWPNDTSLIDNDGALTGYGRAYSGGEA